MAQRFTDRVVVVTGSAGGLGRALAQGFAREGARLVLADVDAAGLEATAGIIAREDLPPAECHTLDVADEAAVQAWGASLCARHPAIHVLYNNAGIAYGPVTANVDKVGMAAWLHYLAVNSLAPLTVANALRPSLAAAGGAIVNQSSIAAYAPATVYGVTKAALNAMTYGMAQAFGGDGVRVNAIAPGLIATEAAARELTEETRTRIRATQLLDRRGGVDDVVALGLFLASDEARFITCEIMICDAGSRVRGWRH